VITGINSEDRLVQATFAEHLERELVRESDDARENETFGPGARSAARPPARLVLLRGLRAALRRLNHALSTVLRPHDLTRFDLERAFETVRRVAAKVSALR
jgi:type I restriction enzyme, R subunit